MCLKGVDFKFALYKETTSVLRPLICGSEAISIDMFRCAMFVSFRVSDMLVYISTINTSYIAVNKHRVDVILLLSHHFSSRW